MEKQFNVLIAVVAALFVMNVIGLLAIGVMLDRLKHIGEGSIIVNEIYDCLKNDSCQKYVPL